MLQRKSQLKIHIEHENTCPGCGSMDIIENHSSGELTCTKCGRVVADRIIDPEREWREFESDNGAQQKSRVGGPQDELTASVETLGTIIDTSGVDEKFKSLTRGRSKPQNKMLLDGFKRIDELADRCELPEKFRTRAKELYKNMDDAKALRGRNQEQIIAGCLFASLRIEKSPRSWKELVAITNIGKKEIGKAYKYILKTLKMNVEGAHADNYLIRFTNHLSLPPPIGNAAEHVAKKTAELGIALGKSPLTVAAAALFLVCNLTGNDADKRSAKEVADISGVTEPTIRNCLKDMEPRKMELLPQSFIQKYMGASAAVPTKPAPAVGVPQGAAVMAAMQQPLPFKK